MWIVEFFKMTDTAQLELNVSFYMLQNKNLRLGKEYLYCKKCLLPVYCPYMLRYWWKSILLKTSFSVTMGLVLHSRTDLSLMEIHNNECFPICFHYLHWLLCTLSDLFFQGFIIRRFLTALQFFSVFLCSHKMDYTKTKRTTFRQIEFCGDNWD